MGFLKIQNKEELATTKIYIKIGNKNYNLTRNEDHVTWSLIGNNCELSVIVNNQR